MRQVLLRSLGRSGRRGVALIGMLLLLLPAATAAAVAAATAAAAGCALT